MAVPAFAITPFTAGWTCCAHIFWKEVPINTISNAKKVVSGSKHSPGNGYIETNFAVFTYALDI